MPDKEVPGKKLENTLEQCFFRCVASKREVIMQRSGIYPPRYPFIFEQRLDL